MKQTLLLMICLFAIKANAQTLAELQRALNTPGKAVQAIHGYPASVDQGKCHWTPVTDISVNGSSITITETWAAPLGGMATTTLTGTLANGKVKGEWSSAYSSGSWFYNFSTSSGQWNKSNSKSPFVAPFKEFYFLKLRIVQKSALLDGAYECN